MASSVPQDASQTAKRALDRQSWSRAPTAHPPARLAISTDQGPGLHLLAASDATTAAIQVGQWGMFLRSSWQKKKALHFQPLSFHKLAPLPHLSLRLAAFFEAPVRTWLCSAPAHAKPRTALPTTASPTRSLAHRSIQTRSSPTAHATTKDAHTSYRPTATSSRSRGYSCPPPSNALACPMYRSSPPPRPSPAPVCNGTITALTSTVGPPDSPASSPCLNSRPRHSLIYHPPAGSSD